MGILLSWLWPEKNTIVSSVDAKLEAEKMATEAECRVRAAKSEEERKEAEEELRKVEEAKKRWAADAENLGIVPDIWPTQDQYDSAQKRLGYNYSDPKFHIAITGNSGSGKSYLVNSFRGLSSMDVGAAQSSTVECTMKVTRYEDLDPKKPIVWFDLPGAGTLSHPAATYFNEKGLFIFDAIVVAYDSRFCSTDIAIIQTAAKYTIPVFLVRSKSDMHISNIAQQLKPADDDDDSEDEDPCMKARREKRARAQYCDETRREVKTVLANANLADQEVYLVSAENLLRVVKGKSPKNALDEQKLVTDMHKSGARRIKPAMYTTWLSSLIGVWHKTSTSG